MRWTEMDDEKNFPPNHNTSLKMKKKKKLFDINKLIQSDEWYLVCKYS